MPHIILLLILALFPVTDLLSAVTYSITGSHSVIFIRLSRDILTIGLCAYAIFKNLIPKNIKITFYLYILILVLHCVISLIKSMPLSLVLSSAATLCLPFIILFAAMAGIRTASDFNRAFIVLIVHAVISTVFGFWERNNTDFWIYSIQYGDYLRDIKAISTGFNSETGLPWNFTGYEDKRRAAGTLAAPLANGFFLATMSFLSIFFLSPKNILVAFSTASFVLIGMSNTETRGALLVIIMAAFFLLLINLSSLKKLLQYSLIVTVILTLTYDEIYEIIYYSINLLDGSTVGHLNAFIRNIEGISEVRLLGYGVGFAGGQASGQGYDIEGGGEGAIFSIAYQVGLPGAFVFLCFYSLLLTSLAKSFKIHGIFKAACALLLGITSSFILSEHILTYSGMAAVWIIAGGLISYTHHLNMVKKNENTPYI